MICVGNENRGVILCSNDMVSGSLFLGSFTPIIRSSAIVIDPGKLQGSSKGGMTSLEQGGLYLPQNTFEVTPYEYSIQQVALASITHEYEYSVQDLVLSYPPTEYIAVLRNRRMFVYPLD